LFHHVQTVAPAKQMSRVFVNRTKAHRYRGNTRLALQPGGFTVQNVNYLIDNLLGLDWRDSVGGKHLHSDGPENQESHQHRGSDRSGPLAPVGLWDLGPRRQCPRAQALKLLLVEASVVGHGQAAGVVELVFDRVGVGLGLLT